MAPLTTPDTAGVVTPPATDEWFKQNGGLITGAQAWQPTTDMTVAGQVKNIVDQNSPLMQQAETKAKQEMAPRGLMNSSLAVGAGQQAVLNAALPIAQQDAQTHVTAARENTAAQNAAQTQQNTFQQQTALSSLDNSMKAALTNADTQTKSYLVALDGQIKTQLANIDADYKTLIQTSASAGQIYNQTIGEVSKILNNADMDAATKQNNVNGLLGNMERALNFVGSINGVDVTDLLTFNAGAV